MPLHADRQETPRPLWCRKTDHSVYQPKKSLNALCFTCKMKKRHDEGNRCAREAIEPAPPNANSEGAMYVHSPYRQPSPALRSPGRGNKKNLSRKRIARSCDVLRRPTPALISGGGISDLEAGSLSCVMGMIAIRRVRTGPACSGHRDRPNSLVPRDPGPGRA